METELKTLLKEYGLDDNEIETFFFIVGNKELTAYTIAKETKIHRSTCYDILDRLVAKGFVSRIEKKGKSLFSANEISRVISNLKDKETILLSLIPKIQKLEEKQETKIKFLEGAEGQKEFNFNLFNFAKNKEITFCYMIGNTYASNLSSNIFIERLIKESKDIKLKKKIEYRAIWDERFRGDKIIIHYNHLGENRFLKNIPSKVGTIICDNFIAYLYTSDKPYVIEIKNKLVAEENKKYFEYLWNLSDK